MNDRLDCRFFHFGGGGIWGVSEAPAAGGGRGLRVRAAGRPSGGAAAGCWAEAPAAGATAAPAQPLHVDMQCRYTTTRTRGALVAEAHQDEQAFRPTPQKRTKSLCGANVSSSRCRCAPRRLRHQTPRMPRKLPAQPGAVPGAGRRPAATAPGLLAAQMLGECRPQAARAPRAAGATATTRA